MSIWVKDPNDVAWYVFDWSQFLATGETITSYTVTADTNLTKLADSSTSTTVSIQVSGGTANTYSMIACVVHTSNSNTYETEKQVIVATRQS